MAKLRTPKQLAAFEAARELVSQETNREQTQNAVVAKFIVDFLGSDALHIGNKGGVLNAAPLSVYSNTAQSRKTVQDMIAQSIQDNNNTLTIVCDDISIQPRMEELRSTFPGKGRKITIDFNNADGVAKFSGFVLEQLKKTQDEVESEIKAFVGKREESLHKSLDSAAEVLQAVGAGTQAVTAARKKFDKFLQSLGGAGQEQTAH